MKRFLVEKIVGGRPVDTGHRYMVVNLDEPYAPKVFEMIRDAERAKGTWDGPETFEEFARELRREPFDGSVSEVFERRCS